MADRGLFIVFEGGEAAGKSTQASRLSSAISARLTREPGGTPLGEALRSITLFQSSGALAARTELLLMVAARAEHVASVLRPTLDAGTNVVCDRFSGSTIAYQGYGRGLPLEDVRAACELGADGLTPDLNVLLDLDIATGRARREQPGDQIESAGAEFHQRVREGFRALATADPDHWCVVDAAAGPDDVERAVHAALLSRLGVHIP